MVSVALVVMAAIFPAIGVKKSLGNEETTQTIKCLPCTHEDLNLSSRTHMKMPGHGGAQLHYQHREGKEDRGGDEKEEEEEVEGRGVTVSWFS